VLRGLLASVGMGLYQRGGLDNRLGDRHPPAGAGHRPPRCHGGGEVSLYARVRGTRRRCATRRRSRRAAIRATTRRAACATRPIRSAIGASGRAAWLRPEARVSESEHYAVEINPPDDCLDHPGLPVRWEEIDPPSCAFRESLREADLGPAGAHIHQWKSQQVALTRFKDDCPPARLARIPPQFGRLPSCRLTARLLGEHGGWEFSRHRASHRSGDTVKGPRALSNRAIFALSTGLPTMGGAILDQPARRIERMIAAIYAHKSTG
jgi:hypothetical protein